MKTLNPLVAALLICVPLSSRAQDATPTPSPAPSPSLSESIDSRLLFSPTGRPPAKGTGYFSDHYVVFPSVTYGLTNHLTLSGGFSVMPGLGLGEQVFYVSPRMGAQFSENFAASGGLLYAVGGDDNDGLGAGFAMATFGRPDKSLTLGAGVVRTMETETVSRHAGGRVIYETRERADHTPVILFGGTKRLSRRVALVSENWLILHDDFQIKEQPFALAVRFFGDRLSADVGVILIGELLDDGFPIPWLSVSYHFGKKR